jgi:hypothetical protein
MDEQTVDVLKPGDRPELKGTVIDWTGGQPINLDRKMDNGQTLEDNLTRHLAIVVDQELRNQKKLVEKLRKWQNNYKGTREAKAFPAEGVANVATPITRSDVDAIFVRVFDSLTNKRRVFLMKPKGVADDMTKDNINKVETAFDNYLKNVVKFKEKMRSPILQAVKTGTGIVRIVHETKYKTTVRYASEFERKDPTIQLYQSPDGGDPLVKDKYCLFDGPNLYPVPREDFLISSDAINIDDAYMCGMGFNLRMPQLKLRAKKGIYIKKNVDKITPENNEQEIKKDRTEAHGVDLVRPDTTETETVRLHELWLSYDVDDDGEEDDIVVTWNHQTGVIVKAIYNPIFYGYRPFCDIRGNAIEFTYDGEGVAEILEPIQEEIDSLHNLRLDRLAQINLPITLVRGGFGINDFKLTPGKTWVLDEDLEAAVRIITFPDVYFSLDREEDRLVAYGDRSVGITPNVLGNSTAERPVAKETLANLEEANKKFKNLADAIRNNFMEVGYKLLECFAQYKPKYEYADENGVQQEVLMPLGNIRDILNLDLEVSSEQMNMEVRREMNIAKYQILSDYMTKLATMVEAFTNPGVPSDMKNFILAVNDMGVKILNDVMEDFDERSPEEVVPDMRKVVNVQKNLMNSPDMQPPAPPQAVGADGQPIEAGPGPGGNPAGNPGGGAPLPAVGSGGGNAAMPAPPGVTQASDIVPPQAGGFVGQ